MYKVVIADDEMIIRMGLCSIINWNDYGFQIIGQAANGKETLRYMTEEKPDLVLMDIKMPGLNGLEALKAARDGGFEGRVVVLSGFSDFEYAQEAINLGVVSYLTKPINTEKLIDILRDIKNELDELNRDRDKKNKYFHHARERLLRDVLSGDIDLSEMKELKAELGLIKGPYQVIIVEKFRPESEEYSLPELLRIKTDPNSPDAVHRDYECIINENADTEEGRKTFILKGRYIIDKFSDLLRKYDMELPPEENSPLDSFFIACGPVVTEADCISDSYEAACFYMDNRFFCDKGQHYFSDENHPYSIEKSDVNEMTVEEVREKLLIPYSDLFVSAVQTFNRNKAAEGLRELQEKLFQSGLTAKDIKSLLIDIYLNVKEKMIVVYSKTEIPFKENSYAISYIMGSYYLYEIVQFISEQFDMIMTAIGGSSRESIIDDVVFYIEHNYAFNITLENLAPLFGYNSSYLGKIFNKKMGMNFNTYLDNVRIEHSKEILLSGKTQVYKVAEMVGYRNVDYFHIKFKKYTGMSPAEFRKRKSAE